MKQWARKNLSALISLIAVLVYAIVVIVIAYGVGFGVRIGEEVWLFEGLSKNTDLMQTPYVIAVCAIVTGMLSLIPMVVKLIFAIFNIGFFSRVLRYIALGLVWVSVILFVTLNIVLVTSNPFEVAIGSIIGFYLLLFIGVVIVTGTAARK